MTKQLYLVTARYDESESEFLNKIEAACANGVTVVQLREKNLSTRDYYELALKVKQITDKYDLPLIIDDRIDICLAVDARGAHIGDDELPVKVARKLLGKDKILGVSAKTVTRATEAAADGADYLGTGAIFPTQTKVVTKQTSIDTLKAITAAVNIPVVAIGGITEERIDVFKGTGIVGVAIVSEIMKATNIAQKVQRLKKALETL
ncbi:thiamine phosphate synthase [Weissella paramesenteroides]|mgnify:FL=1|jgi:thiamine-phosphate pyrophosphorylase|uniref:Thiamine-phosphate synthase n=1 Tax=Weissella paramesenteroides TaxID=1249 RepID=A0ABD4XKU7_WEIPA|nr:thiamine phosphate synthase [Weissella paramesenteroides]MDF8367218.1 thiamine phosphate synthase [Weissella paramesenteroides]MDF8369918.1 thiamine phosphate synthase [Weissella paramesenteroides]MDF8371919.1 thiamine phosphate synthase [Weissella paramesenteroides]MDF8372132.1 thiamine phosphate synthase [Weissella paramesenteroides]WIG65924.1 thiamine phosphate synthase [Weissella paramesenteroides]